MLPLLRSKEKQVKKENLFKMDTVQRRCGFPTYHVRCVTTCPVAKPALWLKREKIPLNLILKAANSK